MYWLAEIGGLYLAGYALASNRIWHSLRARIAAGTLFVLVFVVWTGAYVWQRKESSVMESGIAKKYFTDSDYAGPMLLYLSFGFLVAV
jgi:hypothetical protein